MKLLSDHISVPSWAFLYAHCSGFMKYVRYGSFKIGGNPLMNCCGLQTKMVLHNILLLYCRLCIIPPPEIFPSIGLSASNISSYLYLKNRTNNTEGTRYIVRKVSIWELSSRVHISFLRWIWNGINSRLLRPEFLYRFLPSCSLSTKCYS